MPQYQARNANLSPSKRSFDEAAFGANSDCQQDWCAYYTPAQDLQNNHPSTRSHSSYPPYSPCKRRSSSFSRSNIMLAEHNSIMSGSFPSFMSVFGSEESEVYRRVDIDDHTKLDQNAFSFMTTQAAITQLPQQHNKPFAHRGSVPSLFSESNESSPTTTNSTFDSPLVSDTSASSSPESATSTRPSTDFRSLSMSSEGKSMMALSAPQPAATNTDQVLLHDTTKNVKKLTLDMNLPALRRPATTGSIDSAHPLPAPTSPIKEPLKSARKKPTNLTIRTPGYNQMAFPRVSVNVPPTPTSRSAAQLQLASPTLTTISSPRAPPAGGMFLPLPSLNTTLPNQTSSSSKRGSILINSLPELHEETDNLLPKSQEAPERGYTDGPVCIYDCGVYLYLEPTADEACKFDTVINVAKEVRNPLKSQTGEGTIMSVWRAESAVDKREGPEPQTALSDNSFRSAWEWPQASNTVTPTAATPTQSSFHPESSPPEYVHVPWDHNSEILDDLYPLCLLIDERVAAGKKVLIHCQLGVSRSASLIIAYGLYKNYQPSFHSMYMAVKEKSRWVGPNMTLIYQLTDFKNKVDQGDATLTRKSPDQSWFVRSPEGSPAPTTTESAPAVSATVNPAMRAFEDAADSSVTLDPRPTPLRLNKALPPVPLFSRPDLSSDHNLDHASIAPSPPLKALNPVKRAASRPLPFRARGMDMSIPAHKPRVIPGITLPYSSAVMDLAMKDVPTTPSLFSPRVTEFVATPFNIQGAGDLETPGNRQSKEIPSGFSWLPLRKEGHIRTASKDPRSPDQKGETEEMFTSIDKFL